MLYTIAAILLILWVLGWVLAWLTGYPMGDFVHILLLIALVLVFIDLFSGHRRA